MNIHSLVESVVRKYHTRNPFEIAEERNDIKVGKINVDQENELAEAFGVYSIPTLVVMKDGKIVNQAVGARPKEQILAML